MTETLTLNLAEAIEHLAGVLEAEAKRKRIRRTLEVAAFAAILANGKLSTPVAIEPGDELYIARPESSAAGTISRDPTGRLYALAKEGIAAGLFKRIRADVMEKRWILGGGGKEGNCDDCISNADAGWIPADEPFPTGHDEPDAHPNCTCDMEVQRAEESDEE